MVFIFVVSSSVWPASAADLVFLRVQIEGNELGEVHPNFFFSL